MMRTKATICEYRKPINKDDFLHHRYLSGPAHENTKSGLGMGFFLRAYRICSKDFTDEKVTNTISLFYPKGLILRLKSKASNLENKI